MSRPLSRAAVPHALTPPICPRSGTPARFVAARFAPVRLARLLAVICIVASFCLLVTRTADAVPTQPGFQDQILYTGLNFPTAMRVAQDGRVFIAEKRGIIKSFDSIDDKTPTIFADLRKNVFNGWDRGLLGLAVPPNFGPANPWIYVLYTYDFNPAEPGRPAPRWGSEFGDSDPCPTPPGATGDGCVVSGRLSRLQVNFATNTMTGAEQVLVQDWCAQYPSHTIGMLHFDDQGVLYASGGDGAAFNFADYGQDGSPLNPCGDPPGGVGGAMSPPTAQGGALRAQDMRTNGDPASLSGTIIRIDPVTGAGIAGNPYIASADANARRIVAYGLRNPFRFAVRPGTTEMWIGDVGWRTWEEINRLATTTGPGKRNFGWPCYEGAARNPGYDNLNLSICENLYAQPSEVLAPYIAYQHDTAIVAGENCRTGTSSISGITFYRTGPFPDSYDGALFFGDYSRQCIWSVTKGANGLPDATQTRVFATGVQPVELYTTPTGDLVYVDLIAGAVRRITYGSGGGGGTLPSPWQNRDIGAVAAAGSATFANGIYTVRGSGVDIWGTRDEFQFAYQPLVGDGVITARVASVTNTHEWAKAGVMIRETLNDNARNISVVVNPFNGVWTQWRGVGSGTTADVRGTTGAPPKWVRLERRGNTFNSYHSADGVTWTRFRTWTSAMGVNTFIGLAVTSHADGVVNTATFDNVSLGGSGAPTATIAAPSPTLTWKVGDVITFSGSATDPDEGALPASALRWDMLMRHCTPECHNHVMQSFGGVASGSFVAEDHEYPSFIDIKLTATDRTGVQGTRTISLTPQTATLTFATQPAGLQLSVDATSGAAPFNRTVIVGSNHSLSAPSPQTLAGRTYRFVSWSNGGAQTHNVVAPAAGATYTARFAAQ